ncbi:hypothetical protein [Vibrio sp. TBV020]|uniref:hypothetical protein n=1 Tax=Vibrio sp. TBV020 TaxID=3137398 RepID=UPI0038CDA0EF
MTEQMMNQDERNAFVLENVLDTQGYSSEVKCPNCGQSAEKRNFDECLGGCINSVYSIDCDHCGHHECDQEFCSTCESSHHETESFNYDISKSEQWLLCFDFIEEQLQEGRAVSGLLWTELKQTLYNDASVVNELWTLNTSASLGIEETPQAVIAWYQRRMLDIRFNVRLEERIQHTKLN